MGTAVEPLKIGNKSKERSLTILDPYVIWKDLKPVKRNEFISSLKGFFEVEKLNIDIHLSELPKAIQFDTAVANAFTALAYLRRANARLPKQTRWLTSVLPHNKALHDALALLMKDKIEETIVVTDDPVAICNAAQTDHYGSCFSTNHGRQELRHVIEQSPGLVIAYIINTNTGFMKARAWLVETVNTKTKERGVFISYTYGCFNPETIGRALRLKFPKLRLFVRNTSNNTVSIDWKLEGFKYPGYFDISDCAKMEEILPLTT